jgi:hypothetical protein
MKNKHLSTNDNRILLKNPIHLCGCLGIVVLFASSFANAATSQFTGGKLGSPLAAGLNDIDGDGINDVSLADFESFAAIDATGGYGLTGQSGGGDAWVRRTSTFVAPDQAGTNEAYFSPFRGNIMSSSDNWSKVRFSSGDGWVQWKFAAGSSPVIPLVFVREAPDENLSAAQAWEVAYRVQREGGNLGIPLANGLNDIDGDGINDVSLADFGSFAAIDATGGYGLTGQSGGGDAWVRGTSTFVAPDQSGTNEAYFSPFRGNIMSSSDNWSKVRFSSGDGWVQWKFAAGSSPVIPLVFVREAPDENLSAAHARDIAYAISATIARAHAIKFFGETGVTYVLYNSDDLVTFSPTGASLTGTGSETAFYVEALKPKEFYRVLRE